MGMGNLIKRIGYNLHVRRWRRAWLSESELLRTAGVYGLAPRTPKDGVKGEMPNELRNRLMHLLAQNPHRRQHDHN